MARVHVATPMTGEVRIEHAQFLQWLMLNERRHEMLVYAVEGRPIPDARCKIVNRFLSDPRAEYLMMLDSDQWPVQDGDRALYHNPLDLVARDLDVVGFPYPTVRYTHPSGPLIWLPAEPMPNVPIAATNAVATGCIIIARRVLRHPDMCVPFADVFRPDGMLQHSEDIDFSLKAKAAGFRLWVAMDRPLHHAKTLDLYDLWRALHQDSQPARAGDSPSLPKVGAAPVAPTGEESA